MTWSSLPDETMLEVVNGVSGPERAEVEALLPW